MSGILGLDIGGSRTRARLSEDGRVVGEATGPSASLAAVGPAQAAAVLREVIAGLDGQAVVAAVAGAAGCDTPASRERMRAILALLLPGACVEVVHDARLVLAAEGQEAGIVLIAGTGSVAWGLSSTGEEARAGGWGHLLGDEGSGYWVVREAVRRTLAEFDRGDPPGPLARRLLAETGTLDPLELAVSFHSHREPERWAALSRQVFEADPTLVGAAAAALATLATGVAMSLRSAGPVVLAGGMLLGEPALEAHVREALASLPVRRAEAEPVAGAVHLAERLAAACR